LATATLSIPDIPSIATREKLDGHGEYPVKEMSERARILSQDMRRRPRLAASTTPYPS
jgi:hypothetical protein